MYLPYCNDRISKRNPFARVGRVVDPSLVRRRSLLFRKFFNQQPSKHNVTRPKRTSVETLAKPSPAHLTAVRRYVRDRKTGTNNVTLCSDGTQLCRRVNEQSQRPVFRNGIHSLVSDESSIRRTDAVRRRSLLSFSLIFFFDQSPSERNVTRPKRTLVERLANPSPVG